MKNLLKFAKLQLKSQAPAFAIVVAIVLFAVISANILYRPKPMIKRGFEIILSADGKPVTKAEEKPVDLATMMKTADFDRGAKIFKKCASCHEVVLS